MRFLFLILVCSTISLKATPVLDSLQMENLFNQSLVHLENGQPDSFEYYYQKVAEQLQQHNDLEGWIVKHKTLGKKALLDNNKPDQSMGFLKKSFEDQLFRKPESDTEWEQLGYLYIFAGYVQNNEYEAFDSAKKYYTKAKDILVDKLGIKDYYVARYLLLPLSVIHTIHGDYYAAEILMKQCIQISVKEGKMDYAARVLSDLSVVYLDLGEDEKVIQTCEEGLAMDIEDEVALGLLHSNMAKGQFALGNTMASLTSLDQSSIYFQTLYDHGWGRTALGWLYVNKSLEGEVLGSMGRFREANAAFNEAETYLNNIYDNKYDRDFGKLYQSWGMLKLEEGDYLGAIGKFHQSLQSMLPSFKAENPTQNPDRDLLYAENTLMDALLGKAQAFDLLYEVEKDPLYLNVALDCHELIFEVEKLLRQAYYYENSKLFNLEESRQRCSHAVSVCMKMARVDATGDYEEKAFQFAERSKSVLLLEAFMNNSTLESSGLPEVLLEEEQKFRQEIGDLEEQIYVLETDSLPDAAAIQKQREALYDLKEKYAGWQKEIQQEYHQYYNNRYNDTPLSILEVQDLVLDRDQTLLEYFVGDSMIYLFVVNKPGFEVLEIPKPENLESEIKLLLTSIQQFAQADQTEQLCVNYTSLAQQYFDLLLRQAKERNLLKENVLVIPSGVLSFVQFDALLTGEPKELCRFNEYPYALYDHTFSYGYSANLQAQLGGVESRSYGMSMLGIAPEFDGNDGWGALRANVDLLTELEKIWEGIYHANDQATISRLEKSLEEHSFEIIHLSTHAQANPGKGNFSFIVFSDGSGAYDSLYVNDIYQLSILSELVVLGACETAQGQLYNGEGVISLARAFMQSGSRSVVTTLWSVYDGTNKNVMLDFYANLKEGMSKSQALQKAKINQTQLDSRSAHPVFWAAYVPFGTMEAMSQPRRYGLYAGVLLLIAGAAWIVIRRRKSRQVSKTLAVT